MRFIRGCSSSPLHVSTGLLLLLLLLCLLVASSSSVGVGASGIVDDDDDDDDDVNVRAHEKHNHRARARAHRAGAVDESTLNSQDGPGLAFLVVGDWGGREWWPYSTLAQVRTAAGMARVASRRNATFVLALGDNFYSHGQATPRRLAATYQRVYRQPSLQVPWYVCAGNHDHLGNVTAQLDFHGRDGRWNFPSLFYTVKRTFATAMVGPDGRRYQKTMEAEFVMIDTVVLAGLNDRTDAAHPSYFDPPAGPRSEEESTKHLRWIDRRLARSTADYLFVAGHYPVYSACSHGSTPYLVDRLEPLMKRHGVTAYLSGHEHCALHVERSTVDYILTGTGDECCYEGSNVERLPDDARLQYLLSAERNPTGAVGGFVSLATSTDGEARMEVAYHDQGGRELYTTSLYPRRNKGGHEVENDE